MDIIQKFCIVCQAPITGRRTRFCTQKHAMDWHNSQGNWRELKAKHRANVARKAAYRANPGYWANVAAEWRTKNPEKARLIAQRQKEKHWTNPWITLIHAAKIRARQKNIAFDLTFEWAKERWTGFCELTQIPFSRRSRSECAIFSPSIDRVEPHKGYTQDNCRFILLGVNALKANGTDEAIYLVAKSLIEHLK